MSNIKCECGNVFFGLEGKEDTCKDCLKRIMQPKTMKKYKIEIRKTYVIDVLAKSEADAIAEAEPTPDQRMLNGTEHYVQIGDTEYTAYDVTNTDDPFNP